MFNKTRSTPESSEMKKLTKEDGRVHRQIPTNPEPAYSKKRGEGDKIPRASASQTEYTSQEKGDIEGPTSPPDVTPDAPDNRTNKKADIEGQGKEGRLEPEFRDDWGQYQTRQELSIVINGCSEVGSNLNARAIRYHCEHGHDVNKGLDAATTLCERRT